MILWAASAACKSTQLFVEGAAKSLLNTVAPCDMIDHAYSDVCGVAFVDQNA